MAKFNFNADLFKEFTFMENRFICNNCGSHAPSIEDIDHYENCEKYQGKQKTSKIYNPFKFILAGNAIFTITSFKTGKRFTFKVNKKKTPGHRQVAIWFVRVLTGSDNCNDFEYLGTIFGDTLEYVHGKKSRIGKNAPANKAFRWTYRNLKAEKDISNQCSIHHEGKCGRCGRRLTVPESIESGFGPECIGKV